MPPIDPIKVNAFLGTLNGEGKPDAGFWIAAEGLNALTTMTAQTEQVIFNPNSGIPVKVFINTRTGEMKVYDARAFA